MNQLIWSAGSPLYENSADFENVLRHDSRNRTAPHVNKSSSIMLIYIILAAIPKSKIVCISFFSQIKFLVKVRHFPHRLVQHRKREVVTPNRIL